MRRHARSAQVSLKPIAFTLGFLVFTGVAGLGEAAALPPEARVRVTMRSNAAVDDSTFLRAGVTPGSRIVGSYVFSDDRVIELRDSKGQSRTIPQDVVALFEASRGKKSNAGKGAMIGMLAGIATGVVIGIVLADVEDVDDDYKGAVPVVFGLGGGVLGAGVGAAIGSAAKTERWDVVRSAKEGEGR